jgi:hypothetical protein
MFIRPSFVDILEEWFEDHKNNPHDATEPSLQRVTKDKQNRIAHLPETYNIGNYSIWRRIKKAEKPIRLFHFKMTRPIYVKKFLPLIMKQAKVNKNTNISLEILKEYFEEWKHKHPEVPQLIEEFQDQKELTSRYNRHYNVFLNDMMK